MLKTKYDSKSEIPEGLEKYYTEKSGVFHLQAEGMKTEEDVQSVQAALEKERTFRRDAEKEAKEVKAKFAFVPDDFTAEDFHKLSDSSKGDVDQKLKEQRERLEAMHKKELTAKEAIIAEKDGLVQTHVKDATLSRAIAEANIRKEFVPAVEAMLKSKIKLEGSDVFMNDKPVAEAMKAWIESDEGKHYVAADVSSGGGTKDVKPNQNSNVKTVARSEFDSMSQASRMEFSKSGGKVTD